MSAVCGILRFDRTQVRQTDLDRQLNTMSHRGVDRRRSWRDGSVGLGHALTRVTAEDGYDDQPLIDRGADLCLIADLRLDNREELARVLGIGGAALPTMPDSALVLAAYKRWGENCAENLLGDFVFAIWDGRARKFVLGRDHIGARFVHFYRGRDFFAFATDKKGLWALADVPHELDEAQLARFLIHDFGETQGASLFRKISGLLPATTMVISQTGEIQSRRYWEARADPVHVGRGEAYYVDAYRRILSEAVACRLRRNLRPAALLLSGGFDSTAIAALAAPIMAEQGRKLIAVSSVMPHGYSGPIPNARKWVEACEHHIAHLDVHYETLEDVGLLDGLEESFLKTDNPAAPNRIATTGLFSAAARCGAQVIMDGHGGDYTLNPRAKGWLGRQLRRGRLGTVARELHAYWRNRDAPFWQVLKAELLHPLLPKPVLDLWCRLRGQTPSDSSPMVEREFLASVGVDKRQGGAPHETRKLMRFLIDRMQDSA